MMFSTFAHIHMRRSSTVVAGRQWDKSVTKFGQLFAPTYQDAARAWAEDAPPPCVRHVKKAEEPVKGLREFACVLRLLRPTAPRRTQPRCK